VGDNSKDYRQESLASGILRMNADDWGENRQTTNRILDCYCCGAISSVSAMVFMESSARAASISQEQGIDTGLHLNLTAPFSAKGVASLLCEHHEKVSRFLCSNRFAQAIYHPGLANSFEYVVATQVDEYRRLYGVAPDRIDGHHHMHLCANVQFGRLLPVGTLVRRNLSFQPGERGVVNRWYRELVDRALARRHRLFDFLFTLTPLEPPGRLLRVISLSLSFTVEVEAHPCKQEEYEFLTGSQFLRWAKQLPIGGRCVRKSDAEECL
jgi:chitin disaccharide deacetylase